MRARVPQNFSSFCVNRRLAMEASGSFENILPKHFHGVAPDNSGKAEYGHFFLVYDIQQRFTHTRYGSALYALAYIVPVYVCVCVYVCLSVCLYVCHKPVFYQNGCMDWTGCWHRGIRGFPRFIIVCCKEIQVGLSPKRRPTSIWNFFPKLGTEKNFARTSRGTLQVLSTLNRSMTVASLSPTAHVCVKHNGHDACASCPRSAAVETYVKAIFTARGYAKRGICRRRVFFVSKRLNVGSRKQRRMIAP